MKQNNVLLGLDVGEKRIGVAIADGVVMIARPLETVNVDGQEISRIGSLIEQENAKAVIVGYPRNQSGEPTTQTLFAESFGTQLAERLKIPVHFQDESLTSVLAEERLKSYGKPFKKSDIDAQAAVIILQDYLERA
jgi:putative holliday junction resolvase